MLVATFSEECSVRQRKSSCTPPTPTAMATKSPHALPDVKKQQQAQPDMKKQQKADMDISTVQPE